MEEKNNDLVTMIITTYNRKQMLQKALESVINQTYKNLEIIIADNHSEDGTKEICEEYAKKDSRIVYLRHEKNLGMTGNINEAHKISKGVYMNVLCDDDWLDVDFVEKCYEEITKNPECSFVSPTVKLYDTNYNLIRQSPVVDLHSPNISKRVTSYIIADANHCLITNGLLKNYVTKNMLEEDGFAIKDRFAEDWVYVIKYLIEGRCKVIDSTHYNKLDNGYTTKMETMKEFWDLTGITPQNSFDKIKESIADAVINDKFCQNRLTNNQRSKLANTVIKTKPKNFYEIIDSYIRKFFRLIKLIKDIQFNI